MMTEKGKATGSPLDELSVEEQRQQALAVMRSLRMEPDAWQLDVRHGSKFAVFREH
jgi:hypothetical protein